MKIALTSTMFFGVGNRDGYGGLEIVVADLWGGLVDRGHKVVCFSPDPTVTPEGGFHYSIGPAVTDLKGVDWLQGERAIWQKIDECFDDFDIIHSHDWFGFAYASKSRNPSLKVTHTHHGHLAYWLDVERSRPWWAKPSPFKLNMIAISKFMKNNYDSGYGGQAPLIPSEYAYNPVDLEAYPYQKDKGDRLMFLGRIDAIKNPMNAVIAATTANMPIDVVGGTSFVGDMGYVDTMKNRCEYDALASFIGEVNHATKVKYLQNAKALLIPSNFGEPFGLIAVEAMSCGTVPIALDDGALSEIIEHGKSGFICNGKKEMVEAISMIDTINPADCRKRATRFSKKKCATRYEKLYQRILDGDEW
jgi:glycosyltransferase involved in cell wall biosynthesis